MTTPAARAIAFYLPQFHPVPENDRWWGAGFTEWTNVVRAEPQFDGHYQPHLPADLGFYDLRVPEVRLAQAELARAYGVEGFCYWHYWFKGARLLERPFKAVLASGEPDFPFCLAWANESWSRRWLGEEHAVLLRQEYSLADDVLHARWLAAAFADERYIRVQGRPVFLVYRPRDLPAPQRTTDTIRNEATAHGLPEPLLLGVTSFSQEDFRRLGFDGTVEFAPSFAALPGVRAEGLKRYDYADACRAMGESRPAYPTYPCALVGWDNTPRRGGEAIVLTDSTPKRFEEHLHDRIARLAERPHDDRVLFVNAWNEWAEGNHLEPDQRNGRGHLEALARALEVPVESTEHLDATPRPPRADQREAANPPSRVTVAGTERAAAAPAAAASSPRRRRESAPLIVFGAPRSGTTYLQRILDLHPDIFVTHETRVFAWLHAAVSALPADDQFVVTERKRFVEHLRASLPDVMRDFYRGLNSETRYWGDKNPHYADPANLGCLALVAELFPGAKFVNIIRDGRDVVSSLLRRTDADGRPWVDFEGAHRTWITHLEIGRGFGRRQSPETYYEIRYEEFVRDDVQQARALCSFLDLDLPPAVEAYCAAQATERTPLSTPTRTAIGDVSSSDWASVLTPEQQLRSLELLGPHLVRLGYETQASLDALTAGIAAARVPAMAGPVRSSGGSGGRTHPAPAAGVRRLNWGCGASGVPGWINSDVKEGPGIDISADIRDGLPLEADSLDYIVSIHALPMIHFDYLVPVLQELLRTLKPGGVLRLGLPDLERGVRAYLEGDRSYFAVGDDAARSIGGKFALHMLWYGHSVAMFTAEFAQELLERAGFVGVARCAYRESASGLEGITELDNREDESFFIEAVKPAPGA